MAIATMITGFGQYNIDADTQIRAYVIAADGCRDDAIVSACKRFIRGEVKGHKASRLPTTAEFAQECRSENDTIVARESRRPALPKPPEPIISPEEKARVAEKMKHLRAAIRGDQEARRVVGWEDVKP